MRRVLLEGAAARPYLGARMPRFGWVHTDELAGWLAQREGVWPDSDDTEPEATEDRVLAGRRMMGRAAMACTSCHSFKDYPPAGSPGPNLTAFGERLRYAWWRSYVHDPARYKPGTRMPSFSSGNRSAFADFADGTMTEQADCMWAYFALGEAMPAPEGLSAAQSLQVPLGERPIVLRTFLENAGPRGIAVGFPVGVHFGFDAAGVRLAEVWRGEFLDAAGAWAGRGWPGRRGPRRARVDGCGRSGAPVRRAPRRLAKGDRPRSGPSVSGATSSTGLASRTSSMSTTAPPFASASPRGSRPRTTILRHFFVSDWPARQAAVAASRPRRRAR